ncbi:MAG: preprotein translocase subunit YajC [Bdellovibrionaceae bacterium]|nr:preprotein translocase subunit YajC [Pseudobdellovibrionaceae bacterium]
MFWSSILAPSMAFAQAAPAAGEQPNMLMSLVPFIFIFAVMYFLVIRPQGKKQRDHLKFVSELKRGDEVVTTSGILGRIEGMTEQFVTLEVADGVRLKVLRTQVATSSKSLTEAKKG